MSLPCVCVTAHLQPGSEQVTSLKVQWREVAKLRPQEGKFWSPDLPAVMRRTAAEEGGEAIGDRRWIKEFLTVKERLPHSPRDMLPPQS